MLRCTCVLVVAAALAPLGCSRSGAPAQEAPNAPLARPPFPNMAGDAWGSHILEERARGLGDDDARPQGQTAAALLEQSIAAIHAAEPDGEARAAKLAVTAWRIAQNDVDKGLAAALLGSALVLDPRVDGYKERLTDAHGLAALSATWKAGPVAQAARAHIAAAAGAVDGARSLVEVLEKGPGLPADGRLFTALARFTLGARTDALLADLRAVLAARPDSARARGLLARTLIDLGHAEQAISVVTASHAPDPGFDALHARALALSGRPAEAVALLKAAETKLDEGRRGEALEWLGQALAALGRLDDAVSLAKTLGARPGFAREAKLIEALAYAVRAPDEGQKRLLELTKGPPLPYGDEVVLRRALVEVCAQKKDAACLDDAIARALALDGDEAHGLRARTLLTEGDALLRRAHLLSPFDEALGQRVHLEVVPGGAARASAVRAARRALVRGAPALADETLAAIAEPTCRVCRALRAFTTLDRDEAGRRAVKAVEGKGPPLDESDAAALVPLLQASPTDATKKALASLRQSGGAGFDQAVERAVAAAKARRGAAPQAEEPHASPEPMKP